MIFARVKGTVTGTLRGDRIRGATFLLVEPCAPGGEGRGGDLVALDTQGAGYGEMVLLSQGSSARQTRASDKQPVDAVVIGIVDRVEERGSLVFRKT